MRRAAVTRRRALAFGAFAGLGALLGPLARAVPAARTTARRAAPRGFGFDVAPGDFAGATSRVLTAPRRFHLLGVRGAGAQRVEARVRARGGAWSRWTAVPAADHAPDRPRGEPATGPLWCGPCDELQLRLERAPRRALRVQLVAVELSTGAAAPRARAAQAPPQPGAPPAIVPRAAWGGDAVAPRGAPRYGSVLLAFVHHTATASAYLPQDSAAIVAGIARFHRDVNGWSDLGYNFVVDAYGQVFEARAGGVDQPVIGAQAQGFNTVSTGVALLGTFGVAGIGEPALAATAQLLAWKLSLHGVPTQGQVTVTSAGGPSTRFPTGAPVTFERISGHRDGNATSCPGDALYAQLPDLRARAAALAPATVPRGQVTLTAPPGPLVYGAPAVLAGVVVRPEGSAGAGEPIAVQKRGLAGEWVTVASATAAPDGSWSAALPWRRAGEVRASAVGATSAVASIGLLPRVELTPAAGRRVVAGSALRLSGSVRPAAPMRVLVEIMGRDGAWRRVRLLPARVGGTNWGATVRLRRPGLYRLTPRTAARDGAATPVVVRAVRPR